MRNLERYLLVLILLIVTIFVARSCGPTLQRLTGYQTGLQVELDSSTVYLLNRQTWTEYDLGSAVNELRFIAHAILAPEKLLPDLAFRYNIRYQLLDDAGEIVADKIYHLVSKAAPYIQDEHSELEYSRFYARSELRPSLDQIFYLRLADYPSARTLRVQAAPSPDDVEFIGLRLAVLELIDPVDAVQTWRRMLREQRDFMLRNHIFPPHSVSTPEISNLLQREWKPIGPAGLAGKDYQVDTLYMANLEALDLDQDGDVLASPGAYADPEHWASVVIEPENQGPWQLQFYPEADGDNTVRLRWQSALSREIKVWQVQGNEWVGDLGAGLLEIVPSQAMTFEAEFLPTAYKPERNYVSSYLVEPGKDLRFQFRMQNGGRRQVLRLDYRMLAAQPVGRLSVEVSLYTADGKQITRRSQQLDFVPDRYTQLSSGPAESLISEVSAHYIQLPAEAAYVIVAASEPLLVSGYSRPEDLPLARNLPQDRKYWFEREQRMPQWFTLYPNNEAALLADGRVQALIWHFPILEVDEFIAKDNFQRIEFSPQSITRNSAMGDAIYPRPLLFLDPQADLPRREASMSRYCPLSPSGDVFTLAGAYLENIMAPQLAYSGQRDSQAVMLYLDGESHGPRYLSKSGVLSLGAMALGEHHLSLSRYRDGAEVNGQWWLNAQAKNAACDYAWREVFPLAQGLRYQIAAAHFNDNLAIQFYSEHRGDVSLRLRVRGEKVAGVANAYTLRDTLYHIKGAALPPAYLLDGSGRKVYGPERLNFNLGDDLAGETVSLELTSSVPGGFIAVAQLIPSERERSKVISNLYEQEQE